MIAALGFAPNNEGFGTVCVENNDIDAAKAKLAETFNRDDFVRVVILESAAPISIVGNWKAPFDFKNATLDQIAELMG
jgi:hypothetical protein